MSSESIDRYHVVRECREKCAEEGFSGKFFEECVKECVKRSLSN